MSGTANSAGALSGTIQTGTASWPFSGTLRWVPTGLNWKTDVGGTIFVNIGSSTDQLTLSLEQYDLP
jgi:hypothetical protein